MDLDPEEVSNKIDDELNESLKIDNIEEKKKQ